MVQQTASSVTSFIPMDRRQALVNGHSLADRPEGAALFADISGFTPLTNTLARELGPQRGAEELTRHLNRIYTALIDEVHRYGGSVIGFSGDAITCWFAGGLAAGGAAAACGLAMQRVMGALEDVQTTAGTTIPLAVKVAVTAGNGRRFLVGHPQIRQLEVLAGHLLDRLAAAEQVTQTGEVVIGAEIMGQLGEQAHLDGWRAGKDEHFAVLRGLKQSWAERPWPPIIEPEDQTAQPWLLPLVYERLQQSSATFLAELRPAVALFLKFTGINYDQDEGAGAKLDRFIQWVQATLERYGGHLIQLTMGDKGSYLYAVFGPLIAHEDDPARAVEAALTLRQPPPELAFIPPPQLGISRGQMYTGACGSPTRRTYAVLSNDVNLAARLMSQAQPGQILVTSNIVRSAPRHRFEQPVLMALKGLPEPVPVYQVAEAAHRAGPTQPLASRKTPLIGRVAERTLLAERLTAVIHQRQPGLIIIEGDAGIGKSHLVAHLYQQASLMPLRILQGEANALEQHTPYHAWTPIFAELFGLDPLLDSTKKQRRAVQAYFEEQPERLAELPLLNAVLPLDLPDNEQTAPLSGLGRANRTNDLLSQILQEAVTEEPLLLILEDAHWFDSASWELARLIQHDVPASLLILVSRPPGQAASPIYERFVAQRSADYLRLGNLTTSEISQLLAAALEVDEVPATVTDFIYERAEGHPFFSEELAYAMRDSDFIEIVDGRCRLPDAIKSLDQLDFPDTVQGVITSRIDRLAPDEQLLLKIASVIGRVFAVHVLRGIFPLNLPAEQLEEKLGQLEQLDITTLETPQPNLSYIFKHMITQEVTYNLLLYAQRQELHQAVAEWYEKTHRDEIAVYYPILAHHWLRAEKPQKALHYLMKAGSQAVTQGAYQEAVDFFERGLALTEQLPERPNAYQLASWHQQLGEALYNAGRSEGCYYHSQRALQLLEQPLSKSKAVWGGFILWLIVTRAAQVLLSGGRFLSQQRQKKVSSLTEEEIRHLKLASKTYFQLGQAAYIEGDMLQVAYYGGHSLQLAEKGGQHTQRERVWGYSGVPIVAGPLIKRAAEYYIAESEHILAELQEWETASIAYYAFTVYAFGQGELARASRYALSSFEAAQEAGLTRRVQEALLVQASLNISQGDLSTAEGLYEQAWRTAVRQEDRQIQSWCTLGQASLIAAYKRTEELPFYIKRHEALELEKVDQLAELLYLQSQLLYHWQCQDWAAAEAKAAEVGAIVQRLTSFPELYFFIYWLAIFYLERYKAEPEENGRQVCQTLLKRLNRFAWLLDLGKPGKAIFQGQFTVLNGRTRKGRRQLNEGIILAQEAKMPQEEGLAHYYLACSFPPEAAEHAAGLRQAQAILQPIGNAFILEMVEAKLAALRIPV